MKKQPVWGLFALVAALPAAASASEGFYGGAGLALQMVDYADDGIALTARGGKRLDEVAPHLSVEGEFTYSLVPPSYDVLGNDVEVTYTSLGGYARYSYPVDPITLEGRIGLAYVSAEVDGYSDSEVGLSFGAGVGYDISRELRAVAEYTRVHDDVVIDLDHLGVTVEYAF